MAGRYENLAAEKANPNPSVIKQRKLSRPQFVNLFSSHNPKPEAPLCIEKALKAKNKPYVAEVLQRLQEGEVLLKVLSSRFTISKTRPVFVKLGENQLYFRYGPVPCGIAPNFRKTREKHVDLREIRIIRFGVQESLRSSLGRCNDFFGFVVILEDSFSAKKSLSFVTPIEQTARMWSVGLNHVKNRLQSLLPRLQLELSLWEVYTGSSSDKEKRIPKQLEALHTRGLLSEEGISRFLKKSNEKCLLPFKEFSNLYKSVRDSNEIVKLFQKISPDNDFIRVRELYKFIQQTQRDEDITEEACLQLIQDFEPNDLSRHNEQMTISGFSLFLHSKYCDIFNWKHDQVFQNMGQPLSHYFVASSHNTYLTGDQIKDPSSTESYIKALLKGCRCLELDCWDGPDGEPIIYHGYTLTSKIKFKDVVECIGKYAFEASPYPVILSLENHCSVSQQERMAYYLKTILGSELLSSPLLDRNQELQLPSPNALMGKILLKGKKLTEMCFRSSNISNAMDHEEVSDEDETSDCAHRPEVDLPSFVISNPTKDLNSKKSKSKRSRGVSCLYQMLSDLTRGNNSSSSSNVYDKFEEPDLEMKRISSYNRSSPLNSSASSSRQTSQRKHSLKKKQKLAKQLSDLIVYHKSVKFKLPEDNLDLNYTNFFEMSSISETKAMSLAKQKTNLLVEYHKRQLGRTYPAGSRTDSSNYDPQPLWNAGFQLVSMNYQTKDDKMEIYRGKFRQNGNCGYILKPFEQRCDIKQNEIASQFSPTKEKLFRLKIISCQYIPKHTQLKIKKDEFTCKKVALRVEVSVSGDTNDCSHRSTSCLEYTSSNVEWNEDFLLYISKPELAMVRFVLKDYDRSHERVGQNTLPFTSVTQGYRFVPLMDKDGSRIQGTFVFVRVIIENAAKKHTNPGRVKEFMS